MGNLILLKILLLFVILGCVSGRTLVERQLNASNISSDSLLHAFANKSSSLSPAWGNPSPELHIRDRDYFHFTQANVNASRVNEWYAAWTMERQTDPAWSLYGEWKLFNSDFSQNLNFECGTSFSSCRNAETLYELQSRWPGAANRPLVRRIWFVQQQYSLLHDYINEIDRTMERIHVDLHGMIPELIGTFTLQPERGRVRDCEILKVAIQQLVSLGVQICMAIAFGAIDPAVAEGENAMKWAPQFGMKNSKGNRGTFSIPAQLLSLPGTWPAYTNLMIERVSETQLDIDGGMSYSVICSQFEGDWLDNNGKNMGRLMTWLPEFFSGIRKAGRETFDKVYNGVATYPGGPSIMAEMMGKHKWEGPDSILDEMRRPQRMEMHMKTVLVKGIISDVLAQGYNYMLCTRQPDAAKICAHAKTHPKGISRVRFCPEPETDPNLVCQVAKWYFAVEQSHEMYMVGFDKFESFHFDKFKLRLPELMKESYESYKKCGNTCRNTDWANVPFGAPIKPGGFHLPTCVSDQLTIGDFRKHRGWINNKDAWHFPASCGDFRSNETRDFMKAMKAGPESDVYKTRAPKQLWVDRIPRLLEHMPPYNQYMAACAQYIRFPSHGEYPTIKNTPITNLVGFTVDWKWYTWGADRDCDKVANLTAGMNEHEANDWFCLSKFGRSIQDRQRNHADMSYIPHDIEWNSRWRCRRWFKSQAGRHALLPASASVGNHTLGGNHTLAGNHTVGSG